MELTLEKAYELAVKKWEFVIANNGKALFEFPELPELELLLFNCSYCELFFHNTQCLKCPLNTSKSMRVYRGMCMDIDKHPYKIWERERTKANAQAVLDLIIKTKPI